MKSIEESMSFNKNHKKVIPLRVFEINDSFIVGVYQGSLSEYDILIKYRQKLKSKWYRIRTPKHIHWAVDILIKMHEDREQTQEFLDFLTGVWSRTKPIKSRDERENFLSIENLLHVNQEEIEKYERLGRKGEYNIKFLILLAKLLMVQEKTNLETAYMFKKLLDSLKVGEDIFNIVSVATHRGR
jgi:hypothetical protein